MLLKNEFGSSYDFMSILNENSRADDSTFTAEFTLYQFVVLRAIKEKRTIQISILESGHCFPILIIETNRDCTKKMLRKLRRLVKLRIPTKYLLNRYIRNILRVRGNA
jgi:hypothetical protein